MKQSLKDEKLSATEHETLILICCNMKQKQVAEERCLDFETVQGHGKSIRAKFGCNTMATAVFKAYNQKTFSKKDIARIVEALQL